MTPIFLAQPCKDSVSRDCLEYQTGFENSENRLVFIVRKPHTH